MTPWTLILAAGAGRRLAPVTGGVPKQFWRAAGDRSLLRQTLDRFETITPRSRPVVVVVAGHEQHFTACDVGDWVPDFVRQPVDRGTATGVLLALMPVWAQDPEATVILTPSDHGIVDERTFQHSVFQALREVRRRNAIVLFGVEPSDAHTDYGWISLGPAGSSGGLRPVASFVEKPERQTAARLFTAGAVWNTMVIVARARALWDLYVEKLPELAGVFSRALQRPIEERHGFLARAYADLAPSDFSRDILTGAPGLSAYIWPVSLGWSDLGTPDRLHAWQRISRRPVAGTGAIHAA